MSARAAAAPKPIDEAIRTIPSAWFKPDPRIYWTDLLLSAATGWTAFVLSVRAATPWGRGGLLIVAAFALYRAVLFIHELTHLALQSKRKSPASIGTRRAEPPRRLRWRIPTIFRS